MQNFQNGMTIAECQNSLENIQRTVAQLETLTSEQKAAPLRSNIEKLIDIINNFLAKVGVFSKFRYNVFGGGPIADLHADLTKYDDKIVEGLEELDNKISQISEKHELMQDHSQALHRHLPHLVESNMQVISVVSHLKEQNNQLNAKVDRLEEQIQKLIELQTSHCGREIANDAMRSTQHSSSMQVA